MSTPPASATVTANLATDTHRRSARAARGEARLQAWVPLQPTPKEVVCDVEEARWLWLRRQTLGAQDRAVLELRAQGLTVAEAAEALGLTYKATEAAFTRARAQMRAIWRATAGALGVLCVRPRDAPASAPAYLVAAAVAVGLSVTPNAVPGPAQDRVTPAQRTTAPTVSIVDARALRGAAPEAPPRAAAAPPQRRALTPTAGATPPTPAGIARRAPVQVGDVTVGGTSVTRERPDEDLVQTVRRCAREGVIVSLTEVDCAG